MGGAVIEDIVKRTAEGAAKKAAEDTAKRAAEDAAKRAAEDAAKRAAEDAAKRAAEDAAKKAAEDAAKKAAEDAAKKAGENTAKKSVVRTAGALTRDFMINASRVISRLPVIGPALKTMGITGGLYEVYKHTVGAKGPPPKPEGATQVEGPGGKMQDVRPISKEEAEHRNPADFARDRDGNPAHAPDGRPYVKYDPKDPNETFTSHGFLDNVIKWVADFEKNPSIAPYAPYINAGIAALTAGVAGSLLNPALGLIMALGAGALMYFKGSSFIKDRAAAIDSHAEWQTKHTFNSSARNPPQPSSAPPVKPVQVAGNPAPEKMLGGGIGMALRTLAPAPG